MLPRTPPGPANRCGIDTVEIARVERLLAATAAEDLRRLFTAQELDDSGKGAGRAASLAARFAAKEACVKLFPREAALGAIEPADFSVTRDAYGAPHAVCGPKAATVLAKNRIRGIALSLTHDSVGATAVALALPETATVPSPGRLLFRFLPVRRRVVLENLRRVFGEAASDTEIERLAQAHYAHLWRLAVERLTRRGMRAPPLEVQNAELFARALQRGKGVLLLSAHCGGGEAATLAGLSRLPSVHGRVHFLRRPIEPRWINHLVNQRLRRAGFGVLPERGALDAILATLAAGDAVVFPFDQPAGPPDGIEVDLFGHAAWTSKNLALLALASEAVVLPVASWRDADGRHVLRFEGPVAAAAAGDPDTQVRLTTRACNAALERLILGHPEQWRWMHRRWKAFGRLPGAHRQRLRRPNQVS